MNHQIIRVEMHGASSSQYKQLHTELKRHNIGDEIISDEGRKYRLLTGLYYSTSARDVSSLCDLVLGIARSIVPSAGVVVADAKLISWQGLEEIKSKSPQYVSY